jgi:hypothetical protein
MKRTFAIIARAVIAVLGGYALSAGLSAALAVALPFVSSLPRSESVLLASMLGFVIHLLVLLWVLVERRVVLVLVVLGGGALLSSGVAYWLSPLLAASRVAGG